MKINTNTRDRIIFSLQLNSNWPFPHILALICLDTKICTTFKCLKEHRTPPSIISLDSNTKTPLTPLCTHTKTWAAVAVLTFSWTVFTKQEFLLSTISAVITVQTEITTRFLLFHWPIWLFIGELVGLLHAHFPSLSLRRAERLLKVRAMRLLDPL